MGSACGVVANVEDCEIVENEFDQHFSITLTFREIPLGKAVKNQLQSSNTRVDAAIWMHYLDAN